MDENEALVPASKARTQKRLALLAHGAVLALAIAVSYTLGQRHSSAKRRNTQQPNSGATMMLEPLWCTPIARTHLRTHPLVDNMSNFNHQLSVLILNDHRQFVQQHASDAGDLMLVNDLFFEYQSGTGDVFNRSYHATQQRVQNLTFRHSAQFNTLFRAAATLASRVLSHCGAGARHSARSKRLQAWASVHSANSRHQLHVHAGATLSIVYYVRAGAQAGALRLLDARGPRPPFEGVVEVEAREGEMVAFPGWLAHEVESGGGEEARISVVFNVHGEWEGTDECSAHAVALGDWSRKACAWTLDWATQPPC